MNLRSRAANENYLQNHTLLPTVKKLRFLPSTELVLSATAFSFGRRPLLAASHSKWVTWFSKRGAVYLGQRLIHRKNLPVHPGDSKTLQPCSVHRQISLCALGILEAIDTAGLVGLLVLCPDFPDQAGLISDRPCKAVHGGGHFWPPGAGVGEIDLKDVAHIKLR